jgi:hypothetical protein
MSKLKLDRTLHAFLSSKKKYDNSILDLKIELINSGYKLTYLAVKINVKYSTLMNQFHNKKMPIDNFKKLLEFIE